VRRRRFHYDWHWQWAYGNGDLGNQGVHQMDLARWAIGATRMPKQVLSVGGRFGYVDDGETPNTQVVWLDYDEAPVVFEVRGLRRKKGAKKMDRFLGAGIGVVIHCEHGYVVLTSYNRGHACDLDGNVIEKFEGGGDHFAKTKGYEFYAQMSQVHENRVSEGYVDLQVWGTPKRCVERIREICDHMGSDSFVSVLSYAGMPYAAPVYRLTIASLSGPAALSSTT